MTDKELLELAAKACGMTVQEALAKIGKPISLYSEWNPLGDDGDALRLAVRLQIIVGNYDNYANAGQIGGDIEVTVWNHEEKDPYAATRRAIVRAAAEIGKQKE
jgi:hypothetical protein